MERKKSYQGKSRRVGCSARGHQTRSEKGQGSQQEQDLSSQERDPPSTSGERSGNILRRMLPPNFSGVYRIIMVVFYFYAFVSTKELVLVVLAFATIPVILAQETIGALLSTFLFRDKQK
jgi:hypothetical protein